MKLLFDQNLSPRLPARLAELFPDSVHVRTVGLARADDSEVWEFARSEDFVIVSKDGDFRQRSFLYGHPPKVLWLRAGNCSTRQVEALIVDNAAVIRDFEGDTEIACLVLVLL
jgi:predicted nuclease of predicted toxin-antitoxin system